MFKVLPNRKLFFLLATLAIYSTFWILYNFRETYKNNLFSAQHFKKESLGCEMPNLNPYNKEFTKQNRHLKPVKCIKKDWVKCEFSKCQVVDEVLINMDNVVCSYQDVLYDSNRTSSIVFGSPQKVQGNDAYFLNLSDHVFISCTASPLHGLFNNKSGSFPMGTSWTGRGFGFRPLNTSFLNERSINVLILVFQSLSHNGFLRMFPDSYGFIKRLLNATILKKYNIGGNPDRSGIHSFLPPFSDKGTLKSLDRVSDSSISELKHIEGYRTALLKDQFTFDKSNDWLRPLIDHTFLQDKNRSNSAYSCVQNKPKIQFMFDLIKQYTQLTEKKFGLFFIPDMNNNFIYNIDELLLGLLQHLILHRIHENTLIILMSDHGQRTGSIRNTYQGNIEEKLPFLAISVPDLLESTRQVDIRKILHANAEVLTTPRDIYATLLDAIDIHQHSHSNLQSTEEPRSMSLLKPIPFNRTCSDAGISAYWCACTQWKEIISTNPLFQRAARALLDHINASPTRYGYSLTWIEWVKQGPTEIHKNTRIYSVKIVVQPGPLTFEAELRHNIDEDKFIVNVEDIFRLN